MTNEEAEALIAEIKNNPRYGACGDIHIQVEMVEKIIKRFANKPPEDGYMSNDDAATVIRLLVDERDPDRCYAKIRFNNNDDLVFLHFDASKLKQLRDNFTMMLEYLENA